MSDRLSTLDQGYETGNLSVYPTAIDTKDTLYEVKNNAESVLSKALTYNSNFMLVDDTSKYPDMGLVRVGEELIYYAEKAAGILKDLKRGFAGSKHTIWKAGTKVSHAVMAEVHNSVKDAILNIENFLGTSVLPDVESFNGKLTAIERQILTPCPAFRAYPRTGQSPLKVTFKNFSNNQAIKYFWDFGDGTTSTEISPIHTFNTEGDFSVQLRAISILGGHGVVNKKNYIKIRNDKGDGFMYVSPEVGTTATTFTFVDQTDGDIIERHWVFGDGQKTSVLDPDIHTTTHSYTTAGEYNPILVVIYSDQSQKRVELVDSIVVS